MSDKEKILSIDFDDDNKNYGAFSEFLKDDTKRKKEKFAEHLETSGDNILKEIDRKKKKQKIQKEKYIEYILKKDNKSYTLEELQDYDFDEVRKIYSETKEKNQPFFRKLFKFLFNF